MQQAVKAGATEINKALTFSELVHSVFLVL